MSALPPKADMCGAVAHVCFVPKADIRDLICANRKTLRNPTRPRRALSEGPVSCFDQAAACGLSPADPLLNLPHKFNSALCVLLLPGRRRHQATKPEPPHVGHCCSSSAPFSMTPSPLQSGLVFMRAPHGDARWFGRPMSARVQK